MMAVKGLLGANGSADALRVAARHLRLTRRYFVKAGLGVVAGAGLLGDKTLLESRLLAADPAPRFGPLYQVEAGDPLAPLLDALEYFTPHGDFGTVERGTPLPYTHPEEKLREVGLLRESWRLEVLPDPESNAKIENPLSKELGTALDWAGLMKLAETRAVRYMKVMTCNNGGSPLGMGLWEGVPLRDVVWMAKPVENVRRLFYYGYHNDDPKQMFKSSLPIGRVLEDPPGEHPVLLCYKLNGELLTGRRGGPVRMLVPEAYGFKSVKWLQKVLLTNGPAANDTYADGNNDIDSPLKTFARFINPPTRVSAGQPIPVAGLAQVGISGLSGVQVWLQPEGERWPGNDPYFNRAPWRDAKLLGAPSRWPRLAREDSAPPAAAHAPGSADAPAAMMTDQLPAGVRGFSAEEPPRPTHWPMRHTLAHWAIVLRDIAPGKYQLACRTIDASGVAQPLPRPFMKSGRNQIERTALEVTS